MAAAPDAEVRRAAILALGMIGGPESISVVGRCLQDSDRCVRLIAEIAFADLLKRQMGKAAEMTLNSARRHLEGHRYHRANAVLSDLTFTMPEFAEAWYLRAVVAYYLGQPARAIKYARRAMATNRFHFPACTLEARCWLERDRPKRALHKFEQSFEINPSQTNVQGYIDVLKRQARRINSDDSGS